MAWLAYILGPTRENNMLNLIMIVVAYMCYILEERQSNESGAERRFTICSFRETPFCRARERRSLIYNNSVTNNFSCTNQDILNYQYSDPFRIYNIVVLIS